MNFLNVVRLSNRIIISIPDESLHRFFQDNYL